MEVLLPYTTKQLREKLSRLEQKWTFNGKTFTVEASCNNKCLV